MDSDRLQQFLFGAERIGLDRVRLPLADVQDWECFYCSGRLARSWDVDHFIPWSRHPDNSLDNLVAAHSSCNNAKSASLAGLAHLHHWARRFADPAVSASLDAVRTAAQWPRRPDRILATARATHLWLPEGTRLWTRDAEYEPLDVTEVRSLLA